MLITIAFIYSGVGIAAGTRAFSYLATMPRFAMSFGVRDRRWDRTQNAHDQRCLAHDWNSTHALLLVALYNQRDGTLRIYYCMVVHVSWDRTV
jgi:hypothetical protein